MPFSPKPKYRRVVFKPSSTTAALSGTATASITEADVRTGGKTVVITLTGATWKPSS